MSAGTGIPQTDPSADPVGALPTDRLPAAVRDLLPAAVRDALPATVRQALVAARQLDQPAFISLLPDTGPPAAGIPFAVKDNIDVAGFPTTAACPRLDTPVQRSATAVRRLVDAGAVPIGKTNLDQFATGLVGTRSPYGACHSVAAPDHISGGSSSGSAVAVAAGVVPLALGTDTAGSGRVPAAFNGLVGVKPTRGLVSTLGVLPACRSLDCVTTLTRTVAQARTALDVLIGFDPDDPWSRPRPVTPPPGVARRFTTIAVPVAAPDLDRAAVSAWQRALEHARALGLALVPVDVEPFLAAARLLYGGPWVAERFAAVGHLLTPDGPELDPTVRSIIAAGSGLTAADAFTAFDRLAGLRRQTEAVWWRCDALLLPVTPGHPTLAEVAADPVGVNSRLGTYTNFVNLLDLCAVAVPAGRRDDGLPYGVQLIAPAFADRPLLDLAARWCGEPAPPDATAASTVDPGTVEVVVAGAHQSGLPLNHLLTGRGGELLRRARTAPGYQMVRLPGPGVPRPGLVTGDGPPDGFRVEVWQLPAHALGLLASELGSLHLGPVRLAHGEIVTGYLADPGRIAGGTDISRYGGWRDYLDAVAATGSDGSDAGRA